MQISPTAHVTCTDVGSCHSLLRLPDVLGRQELSLNLPSKLVLSLILEKRLVVLEYYPASLKILEYNF